ncbi:VOC family protein [Demequina capsici]|uniref:VOC family protein n=1 Tax=Demequina capsici TaxID=3075620 RepID=A0AA96JAR0_9MICO|nr:MULTISPECIES: VOC family protein [unclassified Demequina]WNM24976.1 VOC family protein [Demequina sp. OYTSA14]WNM27883.1 VOC family protein [Demequina sp. PMTSA13]
MTMPQGHIAHLGYAELHTTDLDATVWFFENILGMVETRRVDGMSFLRAYDDYEECSIIAKQADAAGVGRTALRATSEQALEERVVAIQAAGRDGRWEDGIAGRGRTFVTTDPDGHEIALYYDTVWYEAPEHLAAGLKNQPAAKPNRGIGVRRFDHINYLAADPAANADWHIDVLGARATEQIRLDDGRVAAKWMTFSSKSYDVVYTEDWTGGRGRLHHLAFATDTREEILRAADLCLDQGVRIETGPHKHAIQQTFFLYVFEPGGNRIEMCNPLTRMVLAPDWPVVTWTQTERLRGQAWGLGTIETFHTHGTPPLEGQDPQTYRPTGMLGKRPSGDARR